MTTRFGYVALIGAPNAGKSTLTNQLVGGKVSIVTQKVQTTRARVLGIGIAGESQIVYVDTPGIFTPKRRLDRAMVSAAWRGAEDADIIALLVDAEQGIDDDTAAILKRLRDQNRRAVLIINKIDLVKRDSLLELTARLNESGLFDRTFMVSALKGDHTGDLADYFAAHVPAGPWHYPEDQLADIPQRLLAAEITREKIFLRLHQEIPYSCTVETENWEMLKDGSTKINQIIYIERDSQKKIVVGKGGAMLKEIGQKARAELEEMLGGAVHLFLFVKVREKWTENPERYREMGLDWVE